MLFFKFLGVTNKNSIIILRILQFYLNEKNKEFFLNFFLTNTFSIIKIIFFFSSKYLKKKNFRIISTRIKVLKSRSEIKFCFQKIFIKKIEKINFNVFSCLNFLKTVSLSMYENTSDLRMNNYLKIIILRNSKKKNFNKNKNIKKFFKAFLVISDFICFTYLSSQSSNGNRLKIKYEILKKNITYILKKIHFFTEILNFIKTYIFKTFFIKNFRKLYHWPTNSIKLSHKKLKNLNYLIFSKIFILPSKSKIPLKIILEEKSIFKLSYNKNNEFIIKNTEDFHFEVVATLILSEFEKFTREVFLDLWLNSYECTKINSTTGIIELVLNSKTLHEIKKNYNYHIGSSDFFIKLYHSLHRKKNFYQSMSGYSLLSYILQIKDRHNCNILLNCDNRIIHLDYGFILDEQPGKFNFESNSFKFTEYFMYKIGGKKSEEYENLRTLFIRAFISIRKYSGNLISVIYTVISECFKVNDIVNKINRMIKRLNVTKSDKIIIKLVNSLFNESFDNWKTIQYDKYQKYVSGINN